MILHILNNKKQALVYIYLGGFPDDRVLFFNAII